MKAIASLVFVGLVSIVAANCGCLKCSKDLSVISDPNSPVQLIVKKSKVPFWTSQLPSHLPLSLVPQLPSLHTSIAKAALGFDALQPATLGFLPQPAPAEFAYKIEIPEVKTPQQCGPICTNLMAGPDRIVIKDQEPPKMHPSALAHPAYGPNFEHIHLPSHLTCQCNCQYGYDHPNTSYLRLTRSKRHLVAHHPPNLLAAPFHFFLRVIPNLLTQVVRLLIGRPMLPHGGRANRPYASEYAHYYPPRLQSRGAPASRRPSKAALMDKLRKINEISKDFDYGRAKRSVGLGGGDVPFPFYKIEDEDFRRLQQTSDETDGYTEDEEEEDLLRPFNFGHMIPHSPLFYFLNTPIRILNHVDNLNNHIKPVLTSVPVVIRNSKKYMRHIGKEVQAHFLDIVSNLIGNFDDLSPINPLNPFLPQRRLKRSSEDTCKQTASCTTCAFTEDDYSRLYWNVDELRAVSATKADHRPQKTRRTPRTQDKRAAGDSPESALWGGDAFPWDSEPGNETSSNDIVLQLDDDANLNSKALADLYVSTFPPVYHPDEDLPDSIATVQEIYRGSFRTSASERTDGNSAATTSTDVYKGPKGDCYSNSSSGLHLLFEASKSEYPSTAAPSNPLLGKDQPSDTLSKNSWTLESPEYTNDSLSTLKAFTNTASFYESASRFQPLVEEDERYETPEPSEAPSRSKRYILKVVDESEVEQFLREKLDGLKQYEEPKPKRKPLDPFHKSKKYVVKKLTPKIIVDKNGKTFVEVDGQKRPLLQSARKGGAKESEELDLRRKISELIEQAKVMSTHKMIVASPSFDSTMPLQTIKDKITEILGDIQRLVTEDVDRYSDLYEELLKLHNVKQLVVDNWKKILINDDCNNLKSKIQLLNDLQNVQTLMSSVFETCAGVLACERNYMTEKLIRTLLRAHKLQCVIHRIVEDFSEKIRAKKPFDPEDEIRYISHLETIWFVNGKSREEVMEGLRRDRDAELQQQTRLLETLRALLEMGASDDPEDLRVITEEAKVLWEIGNLMKLQNDSINELNDKINAGLKLRKELRILFDLQRQLDEAELKQKEILRAVMTADGRVRARKPAKVLKSALKTNARVDPPKRRSAKGRKHVRIVTKGYTLDGVMDEKVT